MDVDSDEIMRIIRNVCLIHRDSGEVSVNREARLIVNALNNAGFRIIKDSECVMKRS